MLGHPQTSQLIDGKQKIADLTIVNLTRILFRSVLDAIAVSFIFISDFNYFCKTHSEIKGGKWEEGSDSFPLLRLRNFD
ncbi:MAG TPA: hypothetical protein DEG17_25495 [Cyanobacteria bacterium UBA11149]|nr:hypothetical protein [Cyanobacteria bacterium UBA11367]HBE57294.1 hypothetical protein [Cyanobacteria bacterium UBA11366]HBK63052.1 hypothetical protein [Cyanobacteria bacterium UBA11166]HBR73331.1 hypothetical protein [Cyanobacteria bacterium UBA11159]HBS71679.1 hypothetical protein [Cyanobacteria bacterium UBA11153]HBW92129.1 hypothetical protein [Cyanobacteria bacterium UBA11149]HCA94313.1 hypothetical protein [Cyanobacteria bacterium UBA9226]